MDFLCLPYTDNQDLEVVREQGCGWVSEEEHSTQTE
jgi:hypothetical protein